MKKIIVILIRSTVLCATVFSLGGCGDIHRPKGESEEMFDGLVKAILNKSGAPDQVKFESFNIIPIRKVTAKQELVDFALEEQAPWSTEEMEERGLFQALEEAPLGGNVFFFWMDEPFPFTGQLWRSDVVAFVFLEGDYVHYRWTSKSR